MGNSVVSIDLAHCATAKNQSGAPPVKHPECINVSKSYLRGVIVVIVSPFSGITLLLTVSSTLPSFRFSPSLLRPKSHKSPSFKRTHSRPTSDPPHRRNATAAAKSYRCQGSCSRTPPLRGGWGRQCLAGESPKCKYILTTISNPNCPVLTPFPNNVPEAMKLCIQLSNADAIGCLWAPGPSQWSYTSMTKNCRWKLKAFICKSG